MKALVTGGEPTINPNLENIIQTIPKKTVVSLVTNGDAFKNNYDYLKKIKDAGLTTIQISYGSNYDKEHNTHLGKKAQDMGVNVCLSTINIYKERENIKEALKLCEENDWHLLYNTPGVGLEKEFDAFTYLSLRSHPRVREDNMFWAGKDICPAGIQKFYISADKSIYPCDRLLDEKFDSYEEMRKVYKGKKKVFCRRFEKIMNGDEN